MNQERYYNLISGRSKGVAARLVYIVLVIVSGIYSVIIRLRNFFYDKHIFAIHHAKATVISVGNITAGGTGKTPLVVWLCNEITSKETNKANECKLAILTRGYKTTRNNTDEPAILTESCPQCKVVVNPDRVIGGAQAIGEYSANVLVLDDGFQHRRLSRDLDIVTVDATYPFGYGRIIPAGLLREPVSSLKRADAVVITRCDQVSEAHLKQIENQVQNIKPGIIIARSIHQPVYVKTIDDRKISLRQFKGKKVFAFCGIGNPNSFVLLLGSMDYIVTGSKFFDDHCNYTDDSLAEIKKQTQNLGAEIILTTQKDWTKIRLLESAKDLPLAYLAVQIRFLSGEKELRGLIEDNLAGKILD
jgi:tetraacyldisaccharide 4'-kinase